MIVIYLVWIVLLSKDAIFCNNRQISTYSDGTYRNTGYGITPTYYSFPRFYNVSGSSISPILTCPQENDKFSVTEVKGNGNLDKPIGLINSR